MNKLPALWGVRGHQERFRRITARGKKGGPKPYRSAGAGEKLPLKISRRIEWVGVSYVLRERDRPQRQGLLYLSP